MNECENCGESTPNTDSRDSIEQYWREPVYVLCVSCEQDRQDEGENREPNLNGGGESPSYLNALREAGR